MQKFLQDSWNPVNIGNRQKNGYTITSQHVSSSWFNQEIVNEGDRDTRLQRYHDIDMTCIEVSRALDIMAEDISSSNADDEETFFIEFPENSKILKSTIKLLEESRIMWQERTGMEYGLYEVSRNTLKYGATFFREMPDGSLRELKPERVIGYVQDPEDESIVTHYIYDPTKECIEDRKRQIQKKHISTKKEEIQFIPVNELLIFKAGKGPFGESIIERVYSLAKLLSLLEESVVVYRILRAPERRIYYIDVGNLQGPKRDAAIEKQRIGLMQKKANKQGRGVTEFDPHSVGEDIFIPTNSTGKGSRVETLPGGQNMNELDDVFYFSKKLAAGLRIPFSMIDTQGDQRDNFSDMRIGQLYQIEMRYMGVIKRHARRFAAVLDKNWKEFCKKRGIEVPEGTYLCITPPMSFALYKTMEIQQQQLNLASSTMNLQSLSGRYVLMHYLHLDPEQVEDNEYQKLLELGLDQEQIKELLPNERYNLIYAQPQNRSQAIMKKYGLSTEEGAGGFGRF